MISRRERLLAEFVNREIEYERFCAMLDEVIRPVFAVWADGGLGKTWLVNRFIAECEQRGISTVLVDEHRHGNYLSVLRTIRDAIGAEHFAGFTDLVNYYTVNNYKKVQVDLKNAGSIVVAPKIENSEVGTVAAVVIEDRNLTAARDDMDVTESERMMKLTEQFAADLQTIDRPIAVFFDATEKMPSGTREWLREALFTYLPEPLGHVRVVMAGRQKPEFDRDTSFLVQEFELKPLTVDHIATYLARRGVSAEHTKELAIMLYTVSAGKPNVIALHTDSYIREKHALGA